MAVYVLAKSIPLEEFDVIAQRHLDHLIIDIQNILNHQNIAEYQVPQYKLTSSVAPFVTSIIHPLLKGDFMHNNNGIKAIENINSVLHDSLKNIIETYNRFYYTSFKEKFTTILKSFLSHFTNERKFDGNVILPIFNFKSDKHLNKYIDLMIKAKVLKISLISAKMFASVNSEGTIAHLILDQMNFPLRSCKMTVIYSNGERCSIPAAPFIVGGLTPVDCKSLLCKKMHSDTLNALQSFKSRQLSASSTSLDCASTTSVINPSTSNDEDTDSSEDSVVTVKRAPCAPSPVVIPATEADLTEISPSYIIPHRRRFGRGRATSSIGRALPPSSGKGKGVGKGCSNRH